MSPKQERELKDLKEKVEKLESILFGTRNDPRYQDKIRSLIIDGEHTAGKPKIVDKNGKTFNLETV
jgi:hypothetical protein